MTPNDQPRPASFPPPSFTPQAGRPPRPSTRDATIEVGDTGDGALRAVPAAPGPLPAAEAPARPAVRRTSSGDVGELSSNAPRAGSSGRIPAPAPRAATPPSARPARPVAGSTRPATYQPTPSTDRPASIPAATAPARPAARPAANDGATGSPAAGSAGRPASVHATHGAGPAGTREKAVVVAGGGAGTSSGGAGGGGRSSGAASAAPGGPGLLSRRAKPRWGRIVALGVALLLILAIAWPVGLLIWANGKINHIDALSGAANTPGTTYLLAGSDSRADGAVGDDGTEGARTDTIMVLHVPDSGPTALISLPRDSYVDIPGNKSNKLNASYSWGGAPLLVATVEGMTGLTVDHYIEIGFSGVETIVDAVGGVELCLDYDVNEPLSGLVWTAGCHMADGTTALAFSRMRYADPQGDIGRAERQRQVIGAVTSAVQDKTILFKPGTQRKLIGAGLDVLTVDEDTNILDLGKMALAFRAANGPDGVTGAPPLSSLDYRPGGVGSAVQLDAERSPQFWADIRDGKTPAGVVGGLPQ